MQCILKLLFLISMSKCFDIGYERSFSSLETKEQSSIQETFDKNTTLYEKLIPENVFGNDDSRVYEQYVEKEYLNNLNNQINGTLIQLDKDGLIHNSTKIYLQKKMLNSVIPIANSYTYYLSKKAYRKENETEADFRYNANKFFLKKQMLKQLQFYYSKLIFQQIPNIRRKILNESYADYENKLTRKNVHAFWEWENLFVQRYREIADYMAHARNYIVTEGDAALYSTMKPQYYQRQMENLAFIADPLRDEHFQL